MNCDKKKKTLDLSLLIGGIIITLLVSVAFNCAWYIIVNSILAIFCVFTQAKGMISTQFLGLIWSLFYIYIAYTQRLYGEVILSVIIIMPMYIYGIIHWLRNRQQDSGVVIINSKLSKRETWIVVVAFCVVSVGVYFLLKALNTNLLIMSTIAFISILPAFYLLMRRHKLNLIFFLINDVVYFILWIILSISGQLEMIVMAIGNLLQAVYDIYGIINWKKIENEQNRIAIVKEHKTIDVSDTDNDA